MGEGSGGGERFRDRRGHVLFIDARKLGRMVDRTHRELTDEEIARIASTYHAWRSIASPLLPPGEGGGEGKGTFEYQDIPGFCKSATLEEIRKHGHILTPGRYVGAEAQEDDGEPLAERMARLSGTLEDQFAENARLERMIRENLRHLGV